MSYEILYILPRGNTHARHNLYIHDSPFWSRRNAELWIPKADWLSRLSWFSLFAQLLLFVFGGHDMRKRGL